MGFRGNQPAGQGQQAGARQPQHRRHSSEGDRAPQDTKAQMRGTYVDDTSRGVCLTSASSAAFYNHPLGQQAEFQTGVQSDASDDALSWKPEQARGKHTKPAKSAGVYLCRFGFRGLCGEIADSLLLRRQPCRLLLLRRQP